MSVCINVGTGHTYTLLTYRILSTFLHKPKWSRGISVGVWVACDGALMKHPRPFLLVHVCLHSCTGGLAEAEVCRPAGNCSAAHYLQGPPPLSLWGWAGQRALNSVSPVTFVDPSHREPFGVSTNNLLSPFLTVGYYTSSIPRWLY